MTKRLLTNKRTKWAEQRDGHTFKGAELNYNAAIQDRYVKELQALTKQMTAQTIREYTKIIKLMQSENIGMDASPASQARIMANQLLLKFASLFKRKAQKMAERMVMQTASASKSSLHQSLKELSGGLSIKTDIFNGKLKEILKATVVENVNLITSIPEQYLTNIQGVVMRSIQSGTGVNEIKQRLLEYEGQTLRKARNTALDQTRKAYNGVNKARMESIGIKKFEWIHSGGGQTPRVHHQEMDGKIYSFDDLPVIDPRTGERGIPGQAINCRCVMRPLVEFKGE
jgi:SPP1 gp7 family putative phage head morphogenesis protein